MSERTVGNGAKDRILGLVKRVLKRESHDTFDDVRETLSNDRLKNGVLIRTFTKGERIPYEPITSLEEVAETLQRLGCQNVLKVCGDENITAVEWTVEYQSQEGNGTSRPTLSFTQSADGSMNCSCSTINSETYKANSEGMFKSPFKFGLQDTPHDRSPMEAMYNLLCIFTLEPHNRIANSGDMFGFQFEGFAANEKRIRVRIGGVKFAFFPTSEPNSVLQGKVQIEVPAEVVTPRSVQKALTSPA